jgi:hypothetical protein
MKLGPPVPSPVQIFTIFKTIRNSLWSGKNSSVLKCFPTTTYKKYLFGNNHNILICAVNNRLECLSDAEYTKWWNPGKLHQIKHPAKCTRKNKKRGTQVPAKKTKSLKWVIKGQRNKLCSIAPTIHLKHTYQKKKGMGSINSIHTSHSSSPSVSPIIGSLSSSIQLVAILQVILCHHNLWH